MVVPQYPTKKAADKGKGKEKDDKDVADENRVCSAIRKLGSVSAAHFTQIACSKSCGDVSDASIGVLHPPETPLAANKSHRTRAISSARD